MPIHFNKGLLALAMSCAIVAPNSLAKTNKSPDDMLGNYKLISTKYGTARAILVCKKDKNGKYYFQVTKLLKTTGYREKCFKCIKRFKDKPIKGMIIAWNFKPTKKTYEFKGGYGIDPWSGRIFQGKINLVGNKNIVKVRANPIGAKFIGRTFNFLRVE